MIGQGCGSLVLSGPAAAVLYPFCLAGGWSTCAVCTLYSTVITVPRSPVRAGRSSCCALPTRIIVIAWHTHHHPIPLPAATGPISLSPVAPGGGTLNCKNVMFTVFRSPVVSASVCRRACQCGPKSVSHRGRSRPRRASPTHLSSRLLVCPSHGGVCSEEGGPAFVGFPSVFFFGK